MRDRCRPPNPTTARRAAGAGDDQDILALRRRQHRQAARELEQLP